MYAIDRLEEHVWQIILPKPTITTLPFARPNTVYALGGPHPALINAGHPSQYPALCSALREIGLEPAHITRIIATSWSLDAAGGLASFPQADAFVFSPDMTQPSAYERWVQSQRDAYAEVVRALAQRPAYAHVNEAALAALLDVALPRVAERLRFIPIRAGHVIAAGPLTLEVISTPGPDAGHIGLFEPTRRWLFSGDLTRDGLPDVIADVQTYLTSMERALMLQPEVLLPTYGLVDHSGAYTLRRTLRFLNNFLSNAPLTMKNSPPTLVEFVERDLGFQPRDVLRFASTLMVYRAFLDELVRTRIITAVGEGLDRRYGIDLDDNSRAEIIQ